MKKFASRAPFGTLLIFAVASVVVGCETEDTVEPEPRVATMPAAAEAVTAQQPTQPLDPADEPAPIVADPAPEPPMSVAIDYVPDPATYEEWPEVRCEPTFASNLEGVRVTFDRPVFTTTPGELRSEEGLELGYTIEIDREISGLRLLAAEANDGRWCRGQKGVSRLVYGVDDEMYVSRGSCGNSTLPTEARASTLQPGKIRGSFTWRAFVSPKARPRYRRHRVDGGEFRFQVRMKGEVDGEPFQVRGTAPIVVREEVDGDPVCRDIPNFNLNRYDAHFERIRPQLEEFDKRRADADLAARLAAIEAKGTEREATADDDDMMTEMMKSYIESPDRVEGPTPSRRGFKCGTE